MAKFFEPEPPEFPPNDLRVHRQLLDCMPDTPLRVHRVEFGREPSLGLAPAARSAPLPA